MIVATATVASVAYGAEKRPNIIFIMTDDQGAWTPAFTGHIGAYTPNIDKFRQEGMHFENAFTTTPVCSPSRATLMTGRYSTEVGITDWLHGKRAGLTEKFTSWPTLLQKAGYTTGLVGKWHLGHKPEEHPKANGFDYFTGFLGGGCHGKDTALEKNGKKQKFPGLLVDNLTTEAMEFIKLNKSKPFCLSLHYRAPHGAYLPVSDEVWEKHKDTKHFVPKDHPELNMKAASKKMKEYCAAVSGIDHNIGRLMSFLKTNKLDDNTIVIFTSDHGYNMGHHGIFGKGNGDWRFVAKQKKLIKWPNIKGNKRPNMYDTSLRVPFYVRWPKKVKANSTNTMTIDFTDLFPTFCALAGAEIPENLQVRGNDFSPLILGQKLNWDNDLYSEYSLNFGGTHTDMRCYRTETWKLMIDFNNPGRGELYHLKNDANEDKNLINSPEYKTVQKQLFKKIIENMTTIKDPALSKVDAWKRGPKQ